MTLLPTTRHHPARNNHFAQVFARTLWTGTAPSHKTAPPDWQCQRAMGPDSSVGRAAD
jgi:hypothetical protein